MHRLSIAAFLLLLAAGAPVAATDFTVTTLFDGALDHDTAPGDGICASSRGGGCGLRTAIEEANARPGLDRILFAVAGTIAPSTEGALPSVTDALVILGETAPGYNAAATDLGNAPPMIFLDGTFLDEEGADAAADGLRFTTGAAQSFVSAIGIVAFPDNGIATFGNASGLNVENCWIGLRADGSAAGNGDDGIELASELNDIGRRQQVDEIVGLGNVISANGANGIRIAAGSGGGNRILGNRIGTTPNGLSARGNAGWGMVVEDGGNQIGRVLLGEPVGNLIAANGDGGIFLFAGSDNEVAANTLGINRSGSFLASPGDGIHALGSGHVIGGTAELQGNRIANHVNGIRVGSGVLGATGVRVRNNRVGSPTFSQGVSQYAIWIDEGDGNQVLENTILHAGQIGIAVGANQTTIQGNRIGWSTTIFGIEDRGTGIHGISVIGHDNVIGRGSVAALVPDPANVIGFSSAHGMLVQGSGNFIGGNLVGVTADGTAIPNGDDGIRLGNVSLQPMGNFIRSNTVRNSFGAGIAVSGDTSATGNAIEFNLLTDNAGPGIDLANDGISANDFADADEGPNRLLNHPVLSATDWYQDMGEERVEITYSLDISSTAATYPLFVDFYLGTEGLRDARAYIGTMVYSSPGAVATADLLLPPGMRGGHVLAMAVDGDNNSSELSPSLPFGDPDFLFSDGFEDLP